MLSHDSDLSRVFHALGDPIRQAVLLHPGQGGASGVRLPPDRAARKSLARPDRFGFAAMILPDPECTGRLDRAIAVHL